MVKFENVALVSIGAELPAEVWPSSLVEEKLGPLYRRLKLPEGRLELMSGIAERRVWAPGTVPSTPSVRSVRGAMEIAGVDPASVGCLIHASVCRDFLEPATASKVHHRAGLGPNCWVYDVSNACLGLINGAIQIASLIEAGAIETGVVVGTENSRPLLESTIDALNQDVNLTRKTVKGAFASLTIGSGSCALLLGRRDRFPDATQMSVGVAEARTEFHDLCVSDSDAAGAGMQPLMETDSETLMAEGIATGVAGLEKLLDQTGWQRPDIDRSVCHQVGVRHRSAMLGQLDLPLERDSVSYPRLGNTGSVALPLTLARAAKSCELKQGNRIALLGIGSGINSVMLAAIWGITPVSGNIGEIV